MKYGKWLVAAALAAPFASPVFADDNPNEDQKTEKKPDMKASDDQGTKVELKDLPAAVQKTLREQSQNKTLGDVRKLTVMGKTMYKAEITSAGKSQTIDVNENGKVTGRHDKTSATEPQPQEPKATPPQAPKSDTGTGTGMGNDTQPDTNYNK